jgi:hypothetical protein
MPHDRPAELARSRAHVAVMTRHAFCSKTSSINLGNGLPRGGYEYDEVISHSV